MYYVISKLETFGILLMLYVLVTRLGDFIVLLRGF